jgi:hypothetical protein
VTGKGEGIGRSWGVFNRRRLPLGEKLTLKLPGGAWLDMAKSVAETQWEKLKESPYLGFTLFVENGEEWFERITALSADFDEDGQYKPVPF